MLSIYFGQMEEAIYFPPVYFDNQYEDEKVDIEKLKVDIRNEKVDFESRLLKKTKGFSTKTIAHIHRMFEQFGYDRIFGRSAIVEL